MSSELPSVRSRGLALVEYSFFAVAVLLGSMVIVLDLLVEAVEWLGIGGADPLATSAGVLLVAVFALQFLFGLGWAVAVSSRCTTFTNATSTSRCLSNVTGGGTESQPSSW